MRHMLEKAYAGGLLSVQLDRVNEWLTEAGIKSANIPLKGAYLVRSVVDDKWYLVARRYVRDSSGNRIKTKIGNEYQKTMFITSEVGTPPDFLLAQENPTS